MNSRTQVTLGILVALMMGLSLGWSNLPWFQPLEGEAPSASPTFTAEEIIETTTSTLSSPVRPTGTLETPRPFETLTGVWMVVIEMYPTTPPQILQVKKLDQGRLSTSIEGNCQLDILDSDEKSIFIISFAQIFSGGDPLQTKDSIRFYAVLPNLEGATTIKLETPQGIIYYDFPTE